MPKIFMNSCEEQKRFEMDVEELCYEHDMSYILNVQFVASSYKEESTTHESREMSFKM